MEMLDFPKKREDLFGVARIEPNRSVGFSTTSSSVEGQTKIQSHVLFRPRKSTKPAIFAALLSITTERRIICHSSMLSSGHTHLSDAAYINTATSTQPKSKARGGGSQRVKIQTPATMALRSAAATLAKRVALASAPQVSI